ncbi:MAG: HPr family phosphocarrier protein [Caloramator sp.]|jgi:phosphocarrier protein|uniref:HPr family phosphocarrier protein n=1 Tax=Caloramator sp. TaxID=1871330 RepID=UPI001D8FEF62|nr:HPr family phosphocarrier protein [Caloramator sp.]MBZ4662748.1 HPr family phosphocarrier protein [Caloramator sp.]
MVEAKAIVQNKTGLHARPATIVVTESKKFKSNIFFKKGDKEVNIKSLLGLLSLAVKQGDEIVIKADGEDEREAVEVIKNLVENMNE